MRCEIGLMQLTASGQHAHQLNSLNLLAGKISPHTWRQSTKTGNNANIADMTAADVEKREDDECPARPDSDTIKMFVGQVSRHLDENDIRQLFEQFGPVYHVNILRDKITGVSKGCCFVTFYRRKSALDAQNELHNICTLPGMSHPIQIKPADNENRNERKLFVGMLNKKYNENDVRCMFECHGAIEECTVLRDSNGQSKGCAFVTFGSREYAMAAIKAMHQTQTMEGCSGALVVKFADTQKDKDAKRLQAVNSSLWAASNPILAASPLNAHYMTLVQQMHGLPTCLASLPPCAFLPSNIAPHSDTVGGYTGLNTIETPLTLDHMTSGGGQCGGNDLAATHTSLSPFFPASPITGSNSATTSATMKTNIGHLISAGMSQQKAPSLCHSGLSVLAAPSTTATAADVINLQHLHSTMPSALAYPMAAYSSSMVPSATARLPSSAASSCYYLSRQSEGPDGCNLFIYHLPQDFSDSDLLQMFRPFGSVISAKVFVDKQTKLSKCFGFVSYDSSVNATAAIQAMNGLQVGAKRLKVQLKRVRDAHKPY